MKNIFQKQSNTITKIILTSFLFFCLFLNTNLVLAASSVNLTYTSNPAKSGTQTITATYSSAITSTPTISINQPGTTDITNANMTAPDGSVWTARTPAYNGAWSGIAYGNGVFVATTIFGYGKVMTSTDGINWVLSPDVSGESWQNVTFGNGLFVAAASNTGSTYRIMTSPDGITWTNRTAPVGRWQNITFGNGTFVAVGYDGGVMTSTDGINWTSRTSANTAIQWWGLTYGNGLFVAVGVQPGGGSENKVMTSPDGITWTQRTSSWDYPWRSVVYGGGKFVAVSSMNNGVMYSTNGINWTLGSGVGSYAWYEVGYGNSLFIAASSGTSGRIMTSTDGINWTDRASNKDTDWKKIIYANGTFVAVGSNGSYVMTSPGVFTYNYTVNTANGSTYVDGTATVSLSATTDIFGVASNSPTNNTFNIDTTGPVATLNYSLNRAVKSGETLTINVAFNEAVPDSPIPQISISGSNTLSATNMTKVDSTHYTYAHAVGSGNGVATVAISGVVDSLGNNISSTINNTFTVDNIAPTNQDTVFSSNAFVLGGSSVSIVSSGNTTNNVWFAPSGTTTFVAGQTMTKATNGTSTSILAPASDGVYKLFIIDEAGNLSNPTTASLTVDSTPPIVSAPISVSQTLKSGTTSTSTVQMNEQGKIYLVKNGTGPSQTLSSSSLSNLLISGSPTNFSFSSGTKNYNGLVVANAVSSVRVTPSIASGTITVNGSSVSSGSMSSAINLTAGSESTISIIATETGKAPTLYTIRIIRDVVVGTLTVGQDYQGGKIFYLLQSGDPGYDSSVQKGFIAGPTDATGGQKAWAPINSTSCYTNQVAGAVGTALGAGSANTSAITSLCNSTNAPAAWAARNYSSGGYSDWYLPSKNELDKLNANSVLPAFSGYYTSSQVYWSSSDAGSNAAWTQYASGLVGSVYLTANNKTGTYLVRPIRTLTPDGTPSVTATTPTFSVAGGSVASGTTITISSTGADAIYYTTDGSTPTTSSTNQATTPLVVNGNITVRALAVRSGYNNAEGTTSYTLIPNWNNLISAHTAFSVNSGNNVTANTAYTVTPVASLLDGVYDIVGVDLVGNISSTLSGWLTIDNTPPINQDTVFTSSILTKGGSSVSIVSSGNTTNNVWFAPSGTTTFVAGQTMTKATNGISTSILAPASEGVYYLYVLDEAGNISSPSVNTLTVDNTSPDVNITYTKNTSGVGTQTITATYSEPISSTPTISINQPGTIDINNVSMTHSGGNVYTYDYLVHIANGSSYVDGTATVSLSSVTDIAGNTSNNPTNNTFIIDTTGPIASVIYSKNPVKNGDSLVITATFSKPVLDTPIPQISISGLNTVPLTNMTKVDTTHYTYTFSAGSGNGVNTVSFGTGVDSSGNIIISTPSSGATFDIDNTGPTITLSSTTPTPTNSTISVDVTSNESISGFILSDITVSNGTAGNLTGSDSSYNFIVTPTSNGNVLIDINSSKVTDLAGNNNSSSNQLTFVYDNTLPVSSITAVCSVPGNACTTNGQSSNPQQSYSVKSLSGSSNDVGVGINSVKISIKDTNTNLWYGDGTTGTLNFTNTNEEYITTTGTNNWSFDTSNIPFVVGNSYLIHIKALDLAGNEESPKSLNFDIANSPPSVHGLSVSNENTTDGSFNISYSATDIESSHLSTSLFYDVGISLSNNLTSNATSVTLSNANNFPSSGYILIDNEIISYTKSSNTLTLNRGRGINYPPSITTNVSTASSHSSGAVVYIYASSTTGDIGYITKSSSEIADKNITWNARNDVNGYESLSGKVVILVNDGSSGDMIGILASSTFFIDESINTPQITFDAGTAGLTDSGLINIGAPVDISSVQYQISDGTTTTDWTSISGETSIPWSFDSAINAKTITYQFKDAYNNITSENSVSTPTPVSANSFTIQDISNIPTSYYGMYLGWYDANSTGTYRLQYATSSDNVTYGNYSTINTASGIVTDNNGNYHYLHIGLNSSLYYRYRLSVVGANGNISVNAGSYTTVKPDGVQNLGEGGGGSVASASKVDSVIPTQNQDKTIAITYELTDSSISLKTNPSYEARIFYNIGITLPSSAFSDGTLAVSDASKMSSTGYIQINNEVLKYTGKNGNILTGIVRGTWPGSSRTTRQNATFLSGTPVWLMANNSTPVNIPNTSISTGQSGAIVWNTYYDTNLVGYNYSNVGIRVLVHDNQSSSLGPLSTQNDYSENGVLNTLDLTAPSVSFETTSSSGLKNISPATFKVVLSRAYPLNSTVAYTLSGTATGGGVDYTLSNGTLTISAGQTTANISAQIINNSNVGPNKTIILTLSNAVNSVLSTNTTHTYTIINHDVDTTPPVLTLVGLSTIHVYSDTTFTDPGATALDDVDGDITSGIVVTGLPNMSTPATYTVTYSATDSSNNTGTITRSVIVDDANSQTFDITSTAGENGSISPSGVTSVLIHNNQGYTITPNEGYGIGTLVVDGVSLAPVSTYTFTNVRSSHTIAVTFTASPDVTAPVITVLGNNPMNVIVGTTFTDPGATALDDRDGDLTSSVVATGTVNANAVKTYTITYTVSDSAKNKATATRTVIVKYADTYDINSSAGAHGSISPSGNNAVASQQDHIYTITPDEGYKISSLLVDGVSLAPVSTYTFTNVRSSHTIAVTFSLQDALPPTITILGDNPMLINSGTTFTDPGATAVDYLGNPVNVNVSGNVNTHSSGTYDITYSATDSEGNIAIAKRSVHVVDITAPIITDIAVPVITHTAAAIVWTTDEPATSQVSYGTESGNLNHTTILDDTKSIYHVVTLSSATNDTNGNPNTLIEETVYYFKVTSTDSSGNSSTSTNESTFSTIPSVIVVNNFTNNNPLNNNTSNIVPDTEAPQITDIEISDINAFGAIVKFKTNEDTLSFVEYGKTKEYGDNSANNIWGKEHKIALRGLRFGTDYHVKITAVDKSGNATSSEDKTFKTKFFSENPSDLTKVDNMEQFQAELESTIESILPGLIPPFIEKPKVTDVTENSAIITFRTNIKSFAVAAYTEDGLFDSTKENPYIIETSDTTEKTLEHKLLLLNLKSNTKYHLQARAFSLPQVVGKSEEVLFTTEASKIHGSIIQKKKDSFVVVWTTDEPTSSIVEYKNLKTGEIASVVDSVNKNTSHSVKIENLDPGTSYQVKISGINEKGNIVQGDKELSVVTLVDVVPPVITSVKVDSSMVVGRKDRVQTIISWQTDEPSNSVVFYEEGSGSLNKPLANKQQNQELTKNHVVVLTVLKPGTVYRFTVESTDDANNTSRPPIRTIITPKSAESIIDVMFKNFDSTFDFIKNVKQ